MPAVRRLVLDLMKPHDPHIETVARHVADVDGVDAVNATLLETDSEVENVKLTLVGDDLGLAAIADCIEDLGGTVHSVDEVVCGDRVVEESRTPQDAGQ